jgi:hypothetical protein
VAPFLGRQHIPRRRRPRDPLLTEIANAIPDAPIREQQIRDEKLFVFGDCDTQTGAIALNVPLLRVLVYLHEGLHRCRPTWSERAVRARTTQLLHTLDDAHVADLNDALLQAISAR